MSCCGKHFPYQQMQEQRHKNSNIWEMAGEQHQENNKGKIVPRRLWDSSPMAAWVNRCRAARGKPLAVKKAKVPSCNIPSVWSLIMHFYQLQHTWIQNGVFFPLWLRNTPQSQFKSIYGLCREIMLLQYPIA